MVETDATPISVDAETYTTHITTDTYEAETSDVKATATADTNVAPITSDDLH